MATTSTAEVPTNPPAAVDDMPATQEAANSPRMLQVLSEATAIRLYNSVVVTDQVAGNSTLTALLPSDSFSDNKSIESFVSADDVGQCRICRWNRSDMEVLRCPCLCKGTVGFIHLQCLKRWMLLRRNSRCEICNSRFNVPDEKLCLRRMMRSFFSTRCCGNIIKNLLFCTSLIPLTHVILQQVLTCMERLNVSPNEQITVKEVMLGTFALLTSSALFFHFFEFITTRILHCRHILRRWWLFGNSSEFSQISLDGNSSDFF